MTNIIDPLPAAPSRADPPATFVTKANAFVAALVPFVTQVNAFVFALAQATANDLVVLLGWLPTPDSFRNRLINGNFDLWQRGTSQTTTGIKSADRWKVDSVTAVTVAQGPASPFGKRSLTLTPTNAVNAITYAQTLEDFRFADMKGGNATFSLYASCPSAGNVTISIQKSATANDSTGGGGGWTTINTLTFALAAGDTRWKVTSAIPNDGTANGLRCVISTANTGNGAAIKIYGCDFSPGSNAPPVEIRPRDVEKRLAQRYCETNFDDGTTPADNTTGQSVVAQAWSGSVLSSDLVLFEVEKRAVPTVTFYSGNRVAGPTAGRWNTLGTAWADGTSTSMNTAYTRGFIANVGGTFTTLGAYLVAGGWMAEAEL